MHKWGAHSLDMMEPQELVYLCPRPGFWKERVPDVLVIEMKLTGKTEFVSSSSHTQALRLHGAGETGSPVQPTGRVCLHTDLFTGRAETGLSGWEARPGKPVPSEQNSVGKRRRKPN